MVRNCVRKTDHQKWDEDNMRKAIKAILNGHMGFLRASAAFEVPKSTLERRVKKLRDAVDDDTDSENDCGKKQLGHFKTVFSKEQEDDLTEHVKEMQAKLFGVTGKELRILAFELATKIISKIYLMKKLVWLAKIGWTGASALFQNASPK
ncbi:hypothetical protein O0L34_g16908 [Tuta absoluta]|nr:hypothetical protein O0L34_g16908 [Tuta absoluta]